MAELYWLLLAEFVVLSSFPAVPVFLILAGYLVGADRPEPRHAAPVNADRDATTWLVRDHKPSHAVELVNARRGGERR